MPNIWDSSKISYSSDEKRIAVMTDGMLGKYYKGVGDDVAKNLNLYRFLLNNLNIPDSSLAEIIKEDNKQIFTAKEISNIKNVLKKHTSEHKEYTDRLLGVKKGGAFNPAIDETRNAFWDKIFNKISKPIEAMAKPGSNLASFLYYFHILYHLEQDPRLGPYISQGLDIVTLSLPVWSEILESLAETFIPIPFANNVVGWVIGSIFLSVSVCLNMSRKHFGSMFKSMLEMIPILGDSVSLAAINFEQGAERFLSYKNKIVQSTKTVSPETAELVEQVYPELNDIKMPEPEPLPPLDTLIKPALLKLLSAKKQMANYQPSITAREMLSNVLESQTKNGTNRIKNSSNNKPNNRANNKPKNSSNNKLKNIIQTKKQAGGKHRRTKKN
jgi:hypothetical protein